jgi:neurofibromin 1
VELPAELSITIRRGLMVVAKIIQNLANNIFFGKEAHMLPLNPFLKENITNVTRFLSEISVRSLACFVSVCLSNLIDEERNPHRH